MIAGRIVYAGSKLSLSNCGSFSALWDICGVMVDIDVNTHCYNVMDRLLVRQEAIQKALADKHLSDGTLVLYDITSSYMEGEYENSKLTDFGYSRDKKRGHKQIIISLLCTKEGCPVAVDVMRGNMKDEKTVLDKIDEIHNKYGLENVVFVGDRGMVTQANYNRINHKTTKVVSAINHNSIKDLCGKGIIQIGMFDEENIIEVIDGNVRYCLCKNPVMAEKESTTRQKLLNATTDSLDKIIMCTRKTKYSKEMRAGKAVNKYKMSKFIVFEGSGNNLSYTVNQEKVEQEASLDGCYVVYTDVPPDIMSAVQTVENYKSLIQVEQAFKKMKTVQLEMRPVFHKTDDRIKCHVFICMLAYYTMWHMKQNLQALFDSDGEAIHRKFTFEYVIENLKSIRKDTVSISSVVSSVISTPSIEQKRILDLLNVKM
jgi:transposase